MAQLQKMQGIHAPIRIQMEKRLVAKSGHLPCITNRTNISADILNGTDGTIAFEDFLGPGKLRRLHVHTSRHDRSGSHATLHQRQKVTLLKVLTVLLTELVSCTHLF